MQISLRPATPDDLVALQPALEFCYGHDAALLKRLPEAWNGFLKMESVWSTVIEDISNPAQRRPILHGMAALVSNRFVAEILASNRPHIGALLVERFLEHGDEPLSLEGIRSGHAGEGISLMNVHSLNVDHPGEPPAGAMAEKMFQANFNDLRGYRFAHALREVYSVNALKAYVSGGWSLRSQYGAETPSLEHPFLLAIDREEMETAAGARMASLFTDYPRRLALKRIHIELLTHALTGMTDDEMAAAMSLSPSAVKKRWRSVYERVDERAPGLLPTVDPLRPEAGRGAERRRHLLNYLREHPEEMRPLED